MGEQFAICKVQHRIEVLDVVFGENIVLLCECGLDRLRCCSDRWAGVRPDNLHEWRSQHVIHREKDDVQRFLAMLFLDQVIDVRNADLCREARIDSASAGSSTIEVGTGVVGVNDVFRLHTQAFQISIKQWRICIDVQHAGNAHAQLLALLHERNAFFRSLIPESRRRNRVGYILRIHRAKDLAGGEVHEVRIFPLDLIETGLYVLHVVDIFDQTLFAGGDNQPLLAMHQRNLGDFLYGDKAHVIRRRGSYIDKGAQTIVLAEMAARLLVARGAVFYFPHSIQSDKRGLQPVAPQAQRLNRRTDGAGFAAEFVNNNFRLPSRRAEAVVDEVDFRLYYRHVVLRPTLQDETRAQCRKIGNTGHVEKHVLWQHGRQASEDFLRAPALTLEIDDVRLHEDGTTVAENRHRLRGKGQIGVLLNAQSKAFRG